MTKQEKVRAGVAQLYKEETGTIIDAYQKEEWKEAYNFADQLCACLHSLGVVIKADRELPKYWFDRGVDGYTSQHYIPSGLQEALGEAGYAAWEPLIEVAKT